MSLIDEHRQKICLRSLVEVAGSRKSISSPCGRYCMETTEFEGDTLRILLTRSSDHRKVFELFTDYEEFDFYHGWVSHGNQSYLLLQEMQGGQTVVDLNLELMESYYDPKDEFIWTDFHLSPSGTKLAAEGCFWAYPWEISIYDFSAPLTLPLPRLVHFGSTQGHLEFCEWLGDDTLVVSDKEGRHVLQIPPAGQWNGAQIDVSMSKP